MNKVILFIILTFSFQLVFAQKEEWTQHFEKTKEAQSMDDAFYNNPDSSKIPALIAKYNEALALIAQVESKSSDYKDAAAYRKACIYSWIGFLYEKTGAFKKMEEYATKALDVWPTFSSINQDAAKKHIKFNDSYPFDVQFTKIIYLAMYGAYENFAYEKAFVLEEKYSPVKKGVENFYEWVINYDLARSYEEYYEESYLYNFFDDGDVSENDVFEQWVKTLELWPAMKTEDKDRNKGPFDFIIAGLATYTTTNDAVKLRAANALYAVEKYTEANKWFNAYKESAFFPPLEVGWKYSESAMKELDKTDAQSAVNIIEKHLSGFSDYDWERLIKVYEFIGDYTKAQEAKKNLEEKRRKAEEERKLREKREEEERKLQAQRDEEERKRREKEERKRNARGRFSVAVATNPIMYVWADYPVSLDIRIGRISNEFRVNITNTRPGKGDNYRFKQWNAEGITDDLRYHYSGYEFSYTLKILGSKGFSSTKSKRKQYVGGYVGFQPRYSMYDFNTEIINFTNSTSGMIETHTISASAQRYEFCLMGGFLGDNLGGFFHVDYYFGVGIGYRNLDITSSNDPNFNTGNYIFDGTTDQRYEPKRWDKLYVPIRLGLRFGINLL